MKTRCKFKVESVKRWSGNFEEIVLGPVPGGTEENESFAFAPSGKLVIVVANTVLLGQIKPGEEYYLDLTPASQP
jgi:hypothetical protein